MPEEGRFAVIERFSAGDVEGNHIAIKASGHPSFYGTELRLWVVVGREDAGDPDHVFPEPFYPQGYNHYNISAHYEPGEDEEYRYFWAQIFEPNTGRELCEPLGFRFQSDTLTYHRATLEWQTEPEPPPPPPPPPPPTPPDLPDNLADCFEAMGDLVHQIGDLCYQAAEILRA